MRLTYFEFFDRFFILVQNSISHIQILEFVPQVEAILRHASSSCK